MKKAFIAQKGPYPIEVKKDQKYFWCRCGLSKKQPFCDGSHKNVTEFKSLMYKADENQKLFFCGCKHTANPPFCDGSHKKL